MKQPRSKPSPRMLTPEQPVAKTIGLCMIVKNESRVILRGLESIRPLIDYVLVEDTGSTDGTQAIIRDWLKREGLPGEVFDEPWQDFAYNRSVALARLREVAGVDYAFVLDADDQVVIGEGFDVTAFKAALSRDVYRVELRHGSTRYHTSQICNNRRRFRYRGVLHEFMEGPQDGVSSGLATGFHILSGREGARSQVADKYEKDAKVLAGALVGEKDPFLRSRYQFYLARSYRDAGEKELALDNFLRRAEMGYWREEVFESLYSAAELMRSLGRPFDDVMAMYSRASDAVPSRAEALHGASRLCRESSKFAEGFACAERGLKIPQPADGLFVQSWIYDYGLLDELAVNAYWIGRYDDAFKACRRLIDENKMPADMHERVRKNAKFAEDKLEPAKAHAQPLSKLAAGEKLGWAPATPAAGTELMVTALRNRMGQELDRINLRVNHPGEDISDRRPRVVWLHHDANQVWVQWCKDKALVNSVRCFVFVSYWQRDRYINAFGLPPERCFVLRHALDQNAAVRHWDTGSIRRCAYTSTPFRGLNVLLDAWESLEPANAELHIWSSMKLYTADDAPYRHLYDRANSLPGVIYHGIVPNPELRAALRTMHFLTYPSTFAETACLAVIEAMAAGCRVIVPSLGALPETTAGYARVYPSNFDDAAHSAVFSENLAAELAVPWDGDPEMSLSQQAHCAAVYDWPRCLREWRHLVSLVCDSSPAIDPRVSPRLDLAAINPVESASPPS